MSARTILDRFVARYIWRSKNGYFSVVRFACFDRFERRSCQNSADRSATTVGLWYTRGDADIFVSTLREESGCHSFAVLFPHRINDIKIVIDLGCAEIQSGSLFAADGEWVGGFGTVKGPANIKAFMEKNMGTSGNATHNYHLLSNFVITVNGDTATAWSRWTFVQPGERGAAIAQAGRYDDTFVRENGVWKFKKRVASNDTGRQGGAAAPANAPPK